MLFFIFILIINYKYFILKHLFSSNIYSNLKNL